MKKLHMTFLNEDGSKKTVIIHCVHQDLSPEAVKEAMVQITELDLFEKDGIRLMTEVHSAKYVEIIETPLFEGNMEPIPGTSVRETNEVVDEEETEEKSNGTEDASIEVLSKPELEVLMTEVLQQELTVLFSLLILLVSHYQQQLMWLTCLGPPEVD